jgi:hypothetical protein
VETANAVSCQLFSTLAKTKPTAVEASEFNIIGWHGCNLNETKVMQIHDCAKLAIMLSSDLICVDIVEYE